jgi:hypothetical protein
LEIAKLYLRTADYTEKQACGIYEIESINGKKSYKIFPSYNDVLLFLKKNKDKQCKHSVPLFTIGKYKAYPHTQIRRLTAAEVRQYMSEREY